MKFIHILCLFSLFLCKRTKFKAYNTEDLSKGIDRTLVSKESLIARNLDLTKGGGVAADNPAPTSGSSSGSAASTGAKQGSGSATNQSTGVSGSLSDTVAGGVGIPMIPDSSIKGAYTDIGVKKEKMYGNSVQFVAMVLGDQGSKVPTLSVTLGADGMSFTGVVNAQKPTISGNPNGEKINTGSISGAAGAIANNTINNVTGSVNNTINKTVNGLIGNGNVSGSNGNISGNPLGEPLNTLNNGGQTYDQVLKQVNPIQWPPVISGSLVAQVLGKSTAGQTVQNLYGSGGITPPFNPSMTSQPIGEILGSTTPSSVTQKEKANNSVTPGNLTTEVNGGGIPNQNTVRVDENMNSQQNNNNINYEDDSSIAIETPEDPYLGKPSIKSNPISEDPSFPSQKGNRVSFLDELPLRPGPANCETGRNKRLIACSLSTASCIVYEVGGTKELGRFPVAIGKKETPTPTTSKDKAFVIEGTFPCPDWCDTTPGSTRCEKGCAPENELGSNWIQFKTTMYGLHGTRPTLDERKLFSGTVADRTITRGCMRMPDIDVRKLTANNGIMACDDLIITP